MSFFTKNSFLASVISDPRGGLLTDKDVYRRYGSTVRTSTTVGGNLDSRLKQIVFEIGRRFDRKAQCFANKPSTVLRVDASYPTNTILAEDFVGLAKKYTNFSAAFEQTSLAGVVERVATALAAQSIYGDISVTDMRGGNALDVNALGTYSGPVNSLSSTVFVPRLVNTVLTGDVFAVLASAVAGEGSSIATDIVELDATTRQPILSEVAGDSLGKACVDALRILGSNMTQCDQGPLFALALVRGLHKVVSMVGHTDEGAVHRDLLRAGAYAPPFGGIHYGLDEYCGLPALSASGPVALAGYVDALVMSSAALVAHCDPGLEYGGRWYPTFYLGTGWSDNEVLPGVGQEGTTVIANRNRDSLLQDYHQFLEVYVPALAKLFGCTGSHQLAASVQSAMSHNLSCDNRHLKFASITPHFWIEPTSIINHDFVGSRCEDEGFASLGGRHSMREKPIFEDIVAAGPGNPNFSTYHVTMRSARTCWLLHHFNGHPKGSLGAVSVKQADPTTIIQSGAGTSDGMLLDKIMNSASIAEFLWVRGQTPFCAPGELMSLTPTYGIQVRHCLFDMHGEVLEEFIPNNSEFLHSVISVHVGLPIGLEPAKANHRASGAKRAKTRAAKELASVALRAARFGRPDMNEMANCLTAPVMRDPPRPTIDESTPYSGPTLAKADSVAIEGVEKKTERATGLAKRVVGIQGTTTVPVVSRPLANQPGGRGNAIPPPRRAEDDEIARPVAPAPPVHVSTVTPLDTSTPSAAPGNGPTAS